MSEEKNPLWFLVRNPRAYGEVKDWLLSKRREKVGHNHTMTCCAVDFADELLEDLQAQMDLNFPPTNNDKPTEGKP